MELDNSGQKLLKFLVGCLPDVMPGDPRTYISYKEVHDQLGLPLEGQTYGESLKIQGLNSLANWTYLSGKPSITGLIIDKRTLMPGDGYFKLFNGGDEDFQWWESEIISCKKYNWLPHFHDFSVLNAVSGDKWSTEELRASIEIYFEMLNFQRRGKSFIKTTYYDELSKRFNRSTKAFEYRMQNISYVLSLMGREWLSGLMPAKNVGARMAAEIENLIFEIEGRQGIATSFDELVVLGEMSKASLPVPSGVPEPMTISSTITQYKRSLEVKAWVLKKADGMCECCANAAPFSRVDGFAYLEVHHVRKLADGGSDAVTNAVAVCPNCHRELHYGLAANELIERLYQNLDRLKRE